MAAHLLMRARRKSLRFLQMVVVAFMMFIVMLLSCMGEFSLIGDAYFAETAEARMGRWCCGLYLYALYIIVLARVSGVLKPRYRSLWLGSLGALFALGLGFFVIKLCFNGLGPSVPSFLGATTLAWSKFWAGVAAVFPNVGFVMLVTPLLLPYSSSSSLMKSLFHKRTGLAWLDRYLSLNETRKEGGDALVDVILVEDDLQCASLVLQFVKKLGLKCHHVESLSEGMRAFERNKIHLRLLILDNFVRVDDAGHSGIKTGSQWARLLNEEHPRSERRFKVALITGHSHLVHDCAKEADLVLQKPWEPRRLFDFLKREGVV